MAAPTFKVGRGSGSSVYRSQGEGIYPSLAFWALELPSRGFGRQELNHVLGLGYAMGSARRALRPSWPNTKSKLLSVAKLSRPFRSLAPLWCCQATQRVLSVFHIF